MKKRVLLFVLTLMLLLGACTPAVQEVTPQTGESLQTEASSEAQTQGTEGIPVPSETETSSGSAVIIDAAYQLAPGEYLEGIQTLTGVITAIDTPYSDKYGNISVVLAVTGSEDKPILCFRLEGSGVEHLAAGDTITVSGEMMNYRGTIEFDAGCTLVSYVSTNPTQPPETQPDASIHDDSKEAVALYIHTYGRLPDFYMTKSQAKRLYGWEGGALDTYAPGYAIGGDTFYNYEGQLPDAPGRRWTECDIDTIGRSARGAKRIVFSNDGLVYYTDDHYETFTLMYGEP